MKNDNEEDRTTTFLSLLFGVCTGTLVFLLIPIYIPAGFTLPASLPITLTPAHYALSFKCQIANARTLRSHDFDLSFNWIVDARQRTV